MPILDVGYRGWEGARTPAWSRWMVVAGNGISLVWRGHWLKRLLIFLTLPALIALLFFGIFEQSIQEPAMRGPLIGAFNSPSARIAAERSGVSLVNLAQNPDQLRHFVWSYLLLTYFRYPQAIGMIIIIGLVAPRLISYDLRSRGYLLYLSRPLTPAEYVLGKACVLYFLLIMVTTIPALLIYLTGLLLSPNPWAIAETWDLPFRVMLATVVLVVPTSAVALAFSSMTQESRYAGFAWFAFWVVGGVTYQTLWMADRRRPWEEFDSMAPSRWMLFSPYECLGHLQQEIFGLIGASDHRIGPWIMCIVASVVGYGVAYWRVSKMLKA
jgi:ABC-2 type transport system permease protein